jgi:hypothetical protein
MIAEPGGAAGRLVLTRDPAERAARARTLLREQLECNVLATILMGMIEGPFAGRPALLGYVPEGEDGASFAALRTSPWPMVASRLAPGTADDLLTSWLREDPDLPGINSIPETAREIAAAWARQTGGRTRVRTRMAMFTLTAVTEPPHPAPGRLRRALPGEAAMLLEWWRAFEIDAGVFTTPTAAESAVAGRLAAERCMLFTDLSNPTSNKIYAEVGYERIGDWEEIMFEPAGQL